MSDKTIAELRELSLRWREYRHGWTAKDTDAGMNALPGLLDEIERLQVARCDFLEDHAPKRITELEAALREIVDCFDKHDSHRECENIARAALDKG